MPVIVVTHVGDFLKGRAGPFSSPVSTHLPAVLTFVTEVLLSAGETALGGGANGVVPTSAAVSGLLINIEAFLALIAAGVTESIGACAVQTVVDIAQIAMVVHVEVVVGVTDLATVAAVAQLAVVCARDALPGLFVLPEPIRA
jgi:hypothetical protein